MRQHVGSAAVEAFIAAVGAACRGPGSVYLAGGASAVLLGWRERTVSVDIALGTEPAGLFGALEGLKRRLDVSIELAAPDQFVPPLPGWQGRSEFLQRVGAVDFYHYDFYTQAFAKLSRGHTRDLQDVAAMAATGWVVAARLAELAELVLPEIARYPSLDAHALLQRVRAWAAGPHG